MSKNKCFFISNSAHPCTEIALDANRIRSFYLANGWTETEDPAAADDVIVSTCAYNQQFEDAALADLRARNAQRHPGSRLISTGCLSRINPKAFGEIREALAVPPLDLGAFDALIAARTSIAGIAGNAVRFQEYQSNPFFARIVKAKGMLQKLSRRFGRDLVPFWMATIPTPDWFFIRGATGCRGRCAYCAVRRAKGTLVSASREAILAQLDHAVRAGAREVSLAGDDMGAWGTDIGADLADLLGAMVQIPGEFRINLRFVEPLYFIRLLDRLAPVFATGRISAFCLPIQSGSNAVLARMARDYTIEEVEAALARFAAIPNRPRLASIIMVGFPGETDEDFRTSCALLDRLPIDLYQILMYEGRPDTPSVSMPDQVPQDVKQARHDRLLRKFKLQKVVGLPAGLVDRLAGLA